MNVTLLDGTKVSIDDLLIQKYNIRDRRSTPFSHLLLTDQDIIEEAEENVYDGWDE